MNKLFGADVRGLLNLSFLKVAFKSACFPVLLITVHVFGFIVIFIPSDCPSALATTNHPPQPMLRQASNTSGLGRFCLGFRLREPDLMFSSRDR
jgi:hypothetical protein